MLGYGLCFLFVLCVRYNNNNNNNNNNNTMSIFSHANFGTDRRREGVGSPKIQNLVKIAFVRRFFNRRGHGIYDPTDQGEFWRGRVQVGFC